jgi:hypothetical protein
MWEKTEEKCGQRKEAMPWRKKNLTGGEEQEDLQGDAETSAKLHVPCHYVHLSDSG